NPYPHGLPPWCGVRGGDPVVQVPAPAEPAGLRLDRTREPVALPRPVMRGRQPPVPAATADEDVVHVLLLSVVWPVFRRHHAAGSMGSVAGAAGGLLLRLILRGGPAL